VQVCNEAGEISEYRIVGPDEADAGSAEISIDAPVARALLGKRVDDEVQIATSSAAVTVSILSIRYLH
jgi:transcription elongation factor GreB